MTKQRAYELGYEHGSNLLHAFDAREVVGLQNVVEYHNGFTQGRYDRREDERQDEVQPYDE